MHATEEEKEIIHNILRFYIPQYEVRAFGSRVTGESLKQFSDLDLVIMTDKKLPIRLWSQVKDAFTLSYLPYRVDLLDWANVSSDFRAVIEKNYEIIQEASTSETSHENTIGNQA